MRARQLVDGLALAGAVIVLVGVVFAANSALAEETQTIDSMAEKAIEAAASDAAESLREENRVDLDIRLLDPTYTLIAGGR